MKQIVVTGATGFIGRHIVPLLVDKGCDIIAIARDKKKMQEMPWKNEVHWIFYDIYDPLLNTKKLLGQPDMIVHLAWHGLPNYNELFHFEQNLQADYRFLKKMVVSGTKHVLVTGTCFEYGLQSGCLNENTPTLPVTSYGLAKDTLRKFLQCLQVKIPFSLQWVRIFYLYGPGQNPNSLLGQLDQAIDRGEPVFNMSGGEQLRDYLPVEKAAEKIVNLTSHPECTGIFNCCSGVPISVRRLVEEHIANRNANIRLNFGYYPYNEYEPMAFWGDGRKLDQVLHLNYSL